MLPQLGCHGDPILLKESIRFKQRKSTLLGILVKYNERRLATR